VTGYEVIVTSVHDRRDLLDRTLRSMLPRLDPPPLRILVHEDVRPGEAQAPGATEDLLAAISLEHSVDVTFIQANPGAGLGRALLHLLRAARSEFVFYTQEDFDFLRQVPVGECLQVMREYELHHVRFNKRKTVKVKGEDRAPGEQFRKLEVAYGGVTLCVSDHWYFQASLWRRALARDGFTAVCASKPEPLPIDRCEVQFNGWLHDTLGGGGAYLRDPGLRQTRLRTFIWGGIGEPAFIRHTGHDRRSQGWEASRRSPDS
jgi:hypothetical protein